MSETPDQLSQVVPMVPLPRLVTNTAVDPDAPVPAPVADRVLGLRDFVRSRDRHLAKGPCQREMLAAFGYVEQQAQRLFDRESAYQARLDAFHTAPVG